MNMMNRLAILAAVSAALMELSSAGESFPAKPTVTAPPTSSTPSGMHDFDFLFGRWAVHHRMLASRLSDSREWIEREGTVNEIPLMDGMGNIEDFFMTRDGVPFHAAALRAFDSKTGNWSIWWLDGRSPVSPLDPPVVGHFENGIGRFYADGDFNGKPIRTRFMWTHTGESKARWEQAFSSDGGKTWETNWIMEFMKL